GIDSDKPQRNTAQDEKTMQIIPEEKNQNCENPEYRKPHRTSQRADRFLEVFFLAPEYAVHLPVPLAKILHYLPCFGIKRHGGDFLGHHVRRYGYRSKKVVVLDTIRSLHALNTGHLGK